MTTDAEHFGLTGPLLGAGARLRIAKVRERSGSRRLRADPRAGDAAHAADRHSPRSRGSTARSSRGASCARRRTSRCSSTVRSRSARSTSMRPLRTSTRSAARSGSAGPDCDRRALRARARRLASAAGRLPERRDVRHRRGDVGAEGRAHAASTRRSRPPTSLAGLEAALAGLPGRPLRACARADRAVPRAPARARPRGRLRARSRGRSSRSASRATRRRRPRRSTSAA